MNMTTFPRAWDLANPTDTITTNPHPHELIGGAPCLHETAVLQHSRTREIQSYPWWAEWWGSALKTFPQKAAKPFPTALNHIVVWREATVCAWTRNHEPLEQGWDRETHHIPACLEWRASAVHLHLCPSLCPSPLHTHTHTQIFIRAGACTHHWGIHEQTRGSSSH